MNIKILGVFSMLILLATSCINEKDDDGEVINYVNVGDDVPEFRVSDGNGGYFESEQFIGKKSLLVFFHTGCPDCKRELPLVEEAFRELPAEEYLIVTVAREQAVASVNDYWSKNNFTMPKYFDLDKSVFSLFANSTIPRLYTINEQGKVTWMAIEKLDMNAELLIEKIKNQ